MSNDPARNKVLTGLLGPSESCAFPTSLLDLLDVAVAIANERGEWVYCNSGFEQLLGYSEQELAGRSYVDIVHPDDKAGTMKGVNDVLMGIDNHYRAEAKHVRKDGCVVWLDMAAKPIPGGEDTIRGFVLSAHDITDKVNILKKCRDEEIKYEALLESSMDAIFLTGPNGDVFFANKAACDLFEMSQEEFVEGRRPLVMDETDPRLPKALEERRSTGSFRGELSYRKKDGTSFEGEVSTRIFRDMQGNELSSVFLRDISGRKQSEELLRSNEKKYRCIAGEQEKTIELLQHINQSLSVVDLVQATIAFLMEWFGVEAVGIRLKEGEDYPYYEARGFPDSFVMAENRLCIHDPHGNVLRDGKGNPALECMCGNVISGRFDPGLPFFTPNGSFWTNSTSILLATATEKELQGRTRNRCNGTGFESVALIPLRAKRNTLGLIQLNDSRRDRFTPDVISLLERSADQLALALAERQSAEALVKNEKKFRAIYEKAPVGIALVDSRTGRYLQVNPKYCEIVGRSEEELLRIDYLSITHPDDQQQGLESMHRMKEGISRFFRVEKRSIRPDGAVVWLNLTVVPMWREGDVPGFHIAMIEDITERKTAVEALRSSLEEKEVLLREVHHRVKNNLASVIGLINLQRSTMEETKSVFMKELECRISSMALVHKTLYNSADLRRISIQDYLSEMIQYLRDAYDPERRIRIDFDANGLALGIDSAIPCGLIVNELITNALKYAFPEKIVPLGEGQCAIAISIREDTEGCTLTVSDNGVGLPTDFDWTNTKTLGMRLIRMLGQHQLGARIRVDGERGTTFTLRFDPRDR